MKRNRTNRKSGQSLIEILGGGMALFLVAFSIMDFGIVVTANYVSDTAAKSAARAASCQHDQPAAQIAASKAVASVGSSEIIQSIALKQLDYNVNNSGNVSAFIRTQVKVPFPIMGLSTVTFNASATEPLVAEP